MYTGSSLICRILLFFHWGDIFRSHDPVHAVNSCFTGVFSRFVPITKLRVKASDKPLFDVDCRRAFDTK